MIISLQSKKLLIQIICCEVHTMKTVTILSTTFCTITVINFFLYGTLHLHGADSTIRFLSIPQDVIVPYILQPLQRQDLLQYRLVCTALRNMITIEKECQTMFNLMTHNANTTFQNKQIKDPKSRAVIDMLQHNHLKIHHFLLTNVTLGGFNIFCSMLYTNKTLTKLDLPRNDIRTLEAKWIAASLKHNQTLTYIDLSFNYIGDIGAQYIAESLKINSTLKCLDLSNNSLDFNTRQSLKAAAHKSLELRI